MTTADIIRGEEAFECCCLERGVRMVSVHRTFSFFYQFEKTAVLGGIKNTHCFIPPEFFSYESKVNPI